MHEMAAGDPACLSLSFMWLHCANVAEWIEVLLGLETFGDPRNIVLDVSPISTINLIQFLPNYFDRLLSFLVDGIV